MKQLQIILLLALGLLTTLAADDTAEVILHAEVKHPEKVAASMPKGPYAAVLRQKEINQYISAIHRFGLAAARNSALTKAARAELLNSLEVNITRSIDGPGITIAGAMRSPGSAKQLWKTLAAMFRRPGAGTILDVGFEKFRAAPDGLAFAWGNVPPQLPAKTELTGTVLAKGKPGLQGYLLIPKFTDAVVNSGLADLTRALGMGKAQFAVGLPDDKAAITINGDFGQAPALTADRVDWDLLAALDETPLAVGVLSLSGTQAQALNQALAKLVGYPKAAAGSPKGSLLLYLLVTKGFDAPEVTIVFPASQKTYQTLCSKKPKSGLDMADALAKGLPFELFASVACLPQVYYRQPQDKQPALWIVGTAPMVANRIAAGQKGNLDIAGRRKDMQARITEDAVGVLHVAAKPLVQEIAGMYQTAQPFMKDNRKGFYKGFVDGAKDYTGQDAWITLTPKGRDYVGLGGNVFNGILMPLLLLNKSLQGHQETLLLTKRKECASHMRFLVGWILQHYEEKGEWLKTNREAKEKLDYVASHVWVCHTNPAVDEPYLFIRPVDKVPTARVPIIIQKPECNFGKGTLLAFADGSTEFVPGRRVYDMVVDLMKKHPQGIATKDWPAFIQRVINMDLNRPDSRSDLNQMGYKFSGYVRDNKKAPLTVKQMCEKQGGPGRFMQNDYNKDTAEPHYLYIPPSSVPPNPRQPIFVENPKNNGGKGGLILFMSRGQQGFLWINGDAVWKHAKDLLASDKKTFGVDDWAPAIKEIMAQLAARRANQQR